MKIAILGAECSGKSTLATALADALGAALAATPEANPSLRSNDTQNLVAVVPEYLRQWCTEHGRTPLAPEQRTIAERQTNLIAASAASITLADTTALMTAVYSDVLLGDTSLYDSALQHARDMDLHLVCGTDLTWLPDGIQRDGPIVRQRIDQRLREVLAAGGIPYSLVYGQGAARTQCAMQPILHRLGLLPPDDASLAAWQWQCEKCSDPQCEHRMFTRLTAKAAPTGGQTR